MVPLCHSSATFILSSRRNGFSGWRRRTVSKLCLIWSPFADSSQPRMNYTAPTYRRPTKALFPLRWVNLSLQRPPNQQRSPRILGRSRMPINLGRLPLLPLLDLPPRNNLLKDPPAARRPRLFRPPLSHLHNSPCQGRHLRRHLHDGLRYGYHLNRRPPNHFHPWCHVRRGTLCMFQSHHLAERSGR